MIKISKGLASFALVSVTNATRITVYTGTAPTVDANFAFALANYTAQAIATYTVTLTQNAQGVIQLSTTPAPINAAITGTATWFAIHSNGTAAVIGSVGPQGSTSPLMVTNVNATTGSPFALAQLGIKFTS